MVFWELTLGYITNLLYDSSKKIPEKILDIDSKIYDKALDKFSNNNYKVDSIQIDTFFHQKSVEATIKKYLRNPDKSICLKILRDKFFELFDEESFSKEDVDLIFNTFFETIDSEIEKDPNLISHLQLYLTKQIHQTEKETNEIVREIYQDVKDISKVIFDGKVDLNTKGSDTYFEEAIREYLNKIIAKDKGIGISQVYTELSVKEILPIALKFRDEDSGKEKEFGVLELVNKEKKLIISGDSGSGKTTTQKWLTFIYAKNCLENLEEKIPLYIDLNLFTKGSFYDYVKVISKGKGISEDTLKILLEGKAVIFLDGLDLLSPDVANKFFPHNEISTFVSEYNNCKFVISSRPGFYESIRSDFKVSELEKLTDKKILEFIDKYIPDRKIGEIIKSKIFKEEKLNSIITTPMMLYLAIKVAMERKNNNEDLIPSERSEIYEAFISGLFSHYEKKRGKILNSDKVQIENALVDLYFELQCNNKTSCTYKEALQIVKKNIIDDGTFRKVTSQDILEDSFNLGLLTKRDSETGGTKVEYGIHQSFQEYFSAIKLKELFERGYDVSEVFCHPKWEEVLIFTSEMLSQVDKFIDLMISKEEQRQKYQPELLVASKCVSKARNETRIKLCALLADKLDSKYILDKINSIESLSRIGNDGISILAEALKYETVRRNAAEALGRIGSDKAILLLIDALKDENNEVRWCAAEALGEMKSEKVALPLLDALKNENAYVRQHAAHAIGIIGLDEAVQSLSDLLNDKNDEVRSSAIRALGTIGSEKAILPIKDAFKDENKHVRMSAVEALGMIGSEKAVQIMIDELKDENRDVQLNIENAFREIKSEKAVKLLIDALNDENGNVRKYAALALGNIKSEKAVHQLMDKLRDELIEVREASVRALVKIRSEKAVQPLIDALIKNDDVFVKQNAVYALGKIGSEKAVQPLIDTLNDKDFSVRRAAAFALGEIKSEEAIKPLIDLLKNDDDGVRSNAANALGTIGSEKAVQPLIDALKDKNKYVQRNAATSLGIIGSEKAVQRLIDALRDENEDVRWCAAHALGENKPKKALLLEKAVQPLIDALKDKNAYVRRNAVETLGIIGSEKAIQPLIDKLHDGNIEVRSNAANALGKVCTVKDKNRLEELLQSEYEFSANAAFEILNEIEKEERAKIILFEKEPSIRKEEVHNEGNSPKIEHIRHAEEGVKDAYFGGFVLLLQSTLPSITEPIIIVDYGCGEGKFLCALKRLKNNLRDVSYIGVDISTKCRYMSRMTAEKYGISQEFKNEPEFLKPEVFSKKDSIVDYVFFLHVLHEIKLAYLVNILHSISSKLKNNGKIFILDQKELVEKERSFVLWDEESDFEMLFKDLGFKSCVSYFVTGSGKHLSSIVIEKVEDKCFTKEEIGRNCLAVYMAKQSKLMEKRKQNGINDREYNEISIQFTNISEQIIEYENTLKKNKFISF